ncbi:Rossmann-like and DUF2520 domain-containing protein [Saccharopolyspora shandongensis]|nr:Rossmann-like and DUF2520 domain-containing protein [Saccharopolyspora shandongensis]
MITRNSVVPMDHLSRDLPEGPVAIVGQGRMGTALARSLRDAGTEIVGPLGRDPDVGNAPVVLLCVPDGAIADVAARLRLGIVVGHCSGATGLGVLGEHEGFSLHPLMTITRAAPASFDGCAAAIAGTTQRGSEVARKLAMSLGMRPIAVAEGDRAAYHAAASVAANFLVTVLGLAEDMAATAGVDRGAFLPLVETAFRNWEKLGASRALTGPIARGDEKTVALQRFAVGQRCPQSLFLFDALVEATRDLAFNRTAQK